MRRTILAVLAVVVAMAVAASSAAATGVAVAGAGRVTATSCLEVNGASVAGRNRWVAAYYPSVEPRPGGACLESDEHIHLTITCADADVTPTQRTFYASAAGSDGALYLLRIVDRGIGDSVAIAPGAPGGDRCGAGALPTTPLVSGDLTVAAG